MLRFHWAEGNDQDHGVSARTGGCWQGRDCLPLINWHNTPDIIQGIAREKATEIFNYLDINSDGKVEVNEFVSGSMRDKELVGMLKRKAEVKSNKPNLPDVCVVLVEEETE